MHWSFGNRRYLLSNAKFTNALQFVRLYSDRWRDCVNWFTLCIHSYLYYVCKFVYIIICLEDAMWVVRWYRGRCHLHQPHQPVDANVRPSGWWWYVSAKYVSCLLSNIDVSKCTKSLWNKWNLNCFENWFKLSKNVLLFESKYICLFI